ncbi:hypothetical protein CPAV1605_390 [seawater metagenome]|uniref:MYM-type domain-containing protein n=1 Tax=seawater metagenome TaxID=1561972 RepID=A0A5E8CL75_9ZZZZ
MEEFCCFTRKKTPEQKKCFFHPYYLEKKKCTQCKELTLKNETIRISTIWKKEYLFCSDDCWEKWAYEFNIY